VVQPKHKIKWNLAKLSSAMQISSNDVKAYFTDGRRASFMMERHMAKLYEGALAEGEGHSYDFKDGLGRKWEVRSITRKGVYFNPSVQVGAGRAFEEVAFRKKVNEIHGFILCDITSFPEVSIYEINSTIVVDWFETGQLGKSAKASLKKIGTLLSAL
jgi:hypothetical protein